MVRLPRRSAEKDQSRARTARHGSLLGRLGETISKRRKMARCGGALTHYIERIDLCAYWRLGCGAYHFVARANRRSSQLGLSLLLVARCGADPARVAARGVPRGSHFLAPMAIARHCGDPGPNANDLQRERGAPTQ